MLQIMICLLVCGTPVFTAAADLLPPNATKTEHPCSLNGEWVNELNSTMVILCNNGSLSGRYRSLVGVAEDFYELSGSYIMTGKDNQDAILSWTVSWNNAIKGNSNSTSSWTGLYYANEGIIYTHWILTRHKEPSDLWSSNMVGHDEFQRAR